MRCKKHPSDQSSAVGVCASCLRERLFALIAAQAQAQQAQAQLQAQFNLAAAAADQHNRKPEPPAQPCQPPLSFPRSVSPYVTRRKSDGSAAAGAWGQMPPPHDQRRNQHLFYSTPQVGPTYFDSASAADPSVPHIRKKKSRFYLLTNLFRSRSDKYEHDHRRSCNDHHQHHHHHSRASCRDSYASSSSSPSWFASIFATNRGRSENMSSAAPTVQRNRTTKTTTTATDRGMSPDFDYACEDFDGDWSPSGCGDSVDSTPSWKRTPVVAPSSAWRSKPGQSRNVSGLAFCLSPLVRASPNRHWTNQKGVQPEIGKSGETVRTPAHPHLANAASFCKNRSRKLVDFGRANHNR